MAGRIDFHTIVRKTHLVSSMVLLLFLLMYVFSGVILINRVKFQVPEQVVEQKMVAITEPMDGAPDVYANKLARELDLKGRTVYRKDGDENWIFNYNFPGTRVTVTLRPEQDSLQIYTVHQERTFFTTVQQMHVLRGFRGGWPYTVWAIFYDTSCLALVLFAVTGILLWFRIRQKYPYGWIFLMLGISVPLLFSYLYLLWR